MRQKLALVAAPALLIALLGLSGSPAGSQEPLDPYVINVTKVVDGDGPTGPYAFTMTCTNPFSDPAGPFNFVLDDGETFNAPVNFNDTCTTEEIDDLGADSVAYTCEVVEFATCLTTGTVAIDQSDNGGEATITVTNTFDPEVIDDGPDPAPDLDADVVTATPTFTG